MELMQKFELKEILNKWT